MRQVTRKSFIAGAASLAATPLWASGGKPPPRAGRPPADDALRAELRAF